MQKMKWFTFLIVFPFLVGCTSPKVFLTTEGLATEKRVQLISKLTNNGFSVKQTVGVRIPEEFSDVVITTNPANESPDFFERLEELLQQQDLSPVTYQKLYQQKHYYKGRDIGLYIRGEEPRMKLPPVLRGHDNTCNEQRLILEFDKNMKLSIYVETEEITSYRGSYQPILPSTIHAKFSDFKNSVTLELSQISVETYAGMKTADKIVVTKSDQEILPVGCKFTIIHY
jgi:hypothetical protein